MNKRQINNYQELQKIIHENQNVYCLIYKPESELSKCVSEKLNEVEDVRDSVVCLVDVSQVKDIHTHYNVIAAPTLLVFKDGKNINQVKGCNDVEFYNNLFNGKYFSRKTSDGNNNHRVTVYTTPTCTYCTSIKKYLDAYNINFREVDISRNPEQAEQLVKRTGQQGVPQTDINGTFVVGFDKNKLNRLLGINK